MSKSGQAMQDEHVREAEGSRRGSCEAEAMAMSLERLARRQRLEAEVAGAGAWRWRGLLVRAEGHGGARLARRKRWGPSEEVGRSEGAR